jgi:hypothetical protein
LKWFWNSPFLIDLLLMVTYHRRVFADVFNHKWAHISSNILAVLGPTNPRRLRGRFERFRQFVGVDKPLRPDDSSGLYLDKKK